MTDDRPPESQLARVLQHAGHELRNPLGAVSGYIRMLLKEQAGAITDQQRRLLTEAQRSCGRLTDLLDQISLLAKIERGDDPLKRSRIELGGVLKEAIGSLPESERPVEVELRRDGSVDLDGDPHRLTLAFASVLFALRRELVTSDRLVVTVARQSPEVLIAIAAPDDVEGALSLAPADLPEFPEFRGGCGLTLPVARRIIEQHGGSIHGAGPDQKAGAVIRLPLT